MELTPLGISGSWMAESPVWHDERGFFREWFTSESIQKFTGNGFGVAQANMSLSSKGTLRGIHYSNAPSGQSKLVTCMSGSILDVIIDVRPSSSTFGKWVSVELTRNSGKSVFISGGLGHAFLALEDDTVVSYLVSTPFSPSEEFEVNPLDEKIGIRWGMELTALKISDKDRNALTLVERLLAGQLPT